jgi:hypothetical protein
MRSRFPSHPPRGEPVVIDTTFDFRSDTPPGKDPDAYSPTLRLYHKLLWSKPLPSGALFDLTDQRRNSYLYHGSELGEFFLASDAVMATLSGKAASVVSQRPESELAAFQAIGYTIGGMMVFPGNKIDGKLTLNGARGFHPLIADRFDLTLECIRRHYVSQQPNPLSETLERYSDFFALFEDFAGYVDFFLLHDLVASDGSVRFFMSFDDFVPPAVPKDVGTYLEYRRRSIEFTHARNKRIDALSL